MGSWAALSPLMQYWLAYQSFWQSHWLPSWSRQHTLQESLAGTLSSRSSQQMVAQGLLGRWLIWGGQLLLGDIMNVLEVVR